MQFVKANFSGNSENLGSFGFNNLFVGFFLCGFSRSAASGVSVTGQIRWVVRSCCRSENVLVPEKSRAICVMMPMQAKLGDKRSLENNLWTPQVVLSHQFCSLRIRIWRVIGSFVVEKWDCFMKARVFFSPEFQPQVAWLFLCWCTMTGEALQIKSVGDNNAPCVILRRLHCRVS